MGRRVGNLSLADRKIALGGSAGGRRAGQHEIDQKAHIATATGIPLVSTHARINHRTLALEEKRSLGGRVDAFDLSEDFDGLHVLPDRRILVNLKCVVGKGGAQTRTLRDQCYRFVESQCRYLVAHPEDAVRFANVFDGNEGARVLRHFIYLLGLYPPEISRRVFVGDSPAYVAWCRT